MKNGLWLLAPLLAALACPASARVDLSAEEREIAQWYTTGAGGMPDRSLDAAYVVDEALKRVLLLDDCPVKPDAQRHASTRYRAVFLDAARLYEELLAEDLRSNGYLDSPWQAAAVHAWRRWQEPQRQAWLTQLRTPQGRRAYEGWRNTMAVEDFGGYAIDIYTGAAMAHPMWPGWLHGFLVRADLVPVFRRAADRVEPGLGDRFLDQAARPLGDAPDEARLRALGELARTVASRWEAIAKAMVDEMAPEGSDARRAIDQWTDHALSREIYSLMLITLNPTPADPSFADFLDAAGQGYRHDARRMEALMGALRAKGKSICDALR